LDSIQMGAYLEATVDGFAVAILVGGGLMVLSALVMASLIRVKAEETVLSH